MASVAAGSYAGVAKAANIVSVKKGNLVSTISRAIGIILNDVVTNGIQGRAVINMSFGAFASTLYPDMLPVSADGPRIDIIGAYLARIYRRGIVVVCSAGNLGVVDAPLNDKTPRLHGGTNTPLIVVGGTTFDGNRWSGSQVIDPQNAGILTIYANGVDVLSASFREDDQYTIATGTSEATATTSGMVAYFLANDVLQSQFAANGLGNIATNVKNYLRLLGTQMKGIARIDPVTFTPDTVPRLANGESVQCTQQNGQVNAPTYMIAISPQEILSTDFSILSVSEGTNIELPQSLLPSCVNL